MARDARDVYREVWILDFEYQAPDGEVPRPVCLVAIELKSGRTIRLWRDELHQPCPIPTDDRSLFVGFAMGGDLACWQVLGWPQPQRCIDLYLEGRMLMYPYPQRITTSLLNVAQLLGIKAMPADVKNEARAMIIGGTFTDADATRLLDYCESDVRMTAEVFLAMQGRLTETLAAWNAALLRGRYSWAWAAIERTGIPVDMERFEPVRRHWGTIKRGLIERIDRDYHVYDGQSFVTARFESWLAGAGIPWPRLESGALALDDRTFRSMATKYKVLGPLRELRHTLSQLQKLKFAIGGDGRNRAFLSPLGTNTGRNTPSPAKFIFGSARWSRHFIQASPGYGLAYVDWTSQEHAIAGALSGDARLWADYTSGDPYLGFAINAGIVPPTATRATHEVERTRCKTIVLGLQYGMAEESMALRAGVNVATARDLLQRHRTVYRRYWEFIERTQDAGSMGLPLSTRFGWVRRVGEGSEVNRRSLGNFPMQATGSEMMRLAACRLVEGGIRVCCPVHDAFLVEAHADELRDVADATQRIMGDVSEYVLGDGYRIRTDADLFTAPEHFVDSKGGGDFYADVWQLTCEAQAAAAAGAQAPAPGDRCTSSPNHEPS